MNGYDPSKCQDKFLEAACEKLNLDSEIQTILSTPKRELKVELPIRLRNGNIARFEGFRVQHNDLCGPIKGGLRFHPSVDMDHCRALAFLMTWKTALFELPFGGGKGGIACDPAKLDIYDLEVLTKQLCTNFGPMVGPDVDIPAPDVGTGEREMAWFFEAYSKRHGFKPGVVTGKPVLLEGIRGRKEATGLGVCKAVLLACESENFDRQNLKVAIQGFGNVGSYAAKYLYESDIDVVAVSDAKGGIYNSNGLDIPTLFHELREGDEIKQVCQSTIPKEDISHDDFFKLKVDVLIPAALEAAITSENVDTLNTKMIVEAANIPVTNNADEVLKDRGVVVVPDIFANGGGVLVSYLEWSGNQSRYSWSRKKVNSFLKERFKAVWDNINSVKNNSDHFSYRDSAYFLAVQRVSNALVTRGLH